MKVSYYDNNIIIYLNINLPLAIKKCTYLIPIAVEYRP